MDLPYLNTKILSIGMCASNNEPMGFDIGKSTIDSELYQDDIEPTYFVDYLQWKLLGKTLLFGECITNNPIKYIYTGRPPEFEKINAEVKNGIIMF